MTKTSLRWHDEIVGFIEDMKGEMFDVYGKWIPLDTKATHDFLAAIESGEEVLVQIGSRESEMTGVVVPESFLAGTISIRYSFENH